MDSDIINNKEFIPDIMLSVTKIPFILFIYLQIMRIAHYSITKQRPAFGAIWFDKGNKDEFADRKIKWR